MGSDRRTLPQFKEHLAAYQITPAHHLGQNFLWDRELLQKMVEKALLPPLGAILEIGSGAGTLTEELALAATRVVSLEIDPSLQGLLTDLASRLPSLTLRFTDARAVDFADLFTAQEKENVQIMANLPYYLTSELIRQCLCQLPEARQMAFLVQKDVVPRLRGSAGDGKSKSKNQGDLAKLIACYGEVVTCMDLPAEHFYPKPRVDSTLIYLRRREGTAALALLETEAKVLAKTIEQAFSQRRKTLVNCFSQVGKKAETEAWLVEAGRSLTCRAEELDADDFASLAKRLYLS